MFSPSFFSVPSMTNFTITTPIEPVSVAGSRDDGVRRHGDVVAARRGDVGHRGDHRLHVARQHHLAPDHVGRDRGSARAVDAQHDRLDRAVGARLAQVLDQRVRADDLPLRRVVAALARS